MGEDSPREILFHRVKVRVKWYNRLASMAKTFDDKEMSYTNRGIEGVLGKAEKGADDAIICSERIIEFCKSLLA